MQGRNNPVAGALYFLRGFNLILQPGLRRYVIAPLLINVVLFAGFIFFGTDQLIALLDAQLPSWLEWLKWLLVPLFLVAAFTLAVFTFGMVANLLASPFNGLLSEAVERHLTGQTAPGQSGWKKMIKELGATLKSELRKLAYIAAWSLPILLLMLVPGVNIIASVLWVVFGAWMLAVAYIDYPMGNHRLVFTEQRAKLREKRWLSLGFGGAVMLALAVPILNFLVVPWAVAGATAMWAEQFAPAKNAGSQPPLITSDSSA